MPHYIVDVEAGLMVQLNGIGWDLDQAKVQLTALDAALADPKNTHLHNSFYRSRRKALAAAIKRLERAK